MMEQAVKAFLESDREWTREHRISHYKWQLSRQTEPEKIEFWKACLAKVED